MSFFENWDIAKLNIYIDVVLYVFRENVYKMFE